MRLMLALLLVIVAPLATAADLTGKDIEHWMKSMPQLQKWLDDHDDQLPQDDFSQQEDSIDAMFRRGIQDLKDAGLYAAFNKEVRAEGYADVEAWADQSGRISLAYLAVEMENDPVTLSQMEAQLQQIRESDLPAEQKAMMEQVMSASLMMVRAVAQVSDADKEAVRPYRGQLAAQFDNGGEE